MMGFGTTCTYTPLSSGPVVVHVNGFLSNTSSDACVIGPRYGSLGGSITTIGSGSAGGTISTIASWSSPGAGTLDVAAVAGNWPPSGTLWIGTAGTAAQVTYTGFTSASFTGCAYVSGAGSTGGTVSAAQQVYGYPPNGAIVTGTRFGAATDPNAQGDNLTGGTGFGFNGLLNLTPGTSYWFDMSAVPSGAHPTATNAVGMTMYELPS
jgi:hypothetical protein